MIVVGVKHMSFPDREKPDVMVSGINLFLGKPIEDGEGFEFQLKKDYKIFLNDWKIEHWLKGEIPRPGDQVFAEWDSEGRLRGITIAPPATK